MKPVGRLAVIGTGLIGTSFATALRQRALVEYVTGFDIDAGAAAEASRCGHVDYVAASVDEAVATADLVFIAVPVGQFGTVLRRIAGSVNRQCVITDACSVKACIVAEAHAILGDGVDRFVAAHPIAGSERNGPAFASAGLFDGRDVAICGGPDTGAPAIEWVRGLWSACGATVLTMTPQEHDLRLGLVSHLPHLLAFAAMTRYAQADGVAALRVAGQGFRDFSRIAAADPEVWRDIFVSNAEVLVREIDFFAAELQRLRQAVVVKDGAEIARTISRSRSLRQSLTS